MGKNSQYLADEMPEWWYFLQSIGKWAFTNKGTYICAICPDDIFSSYAVASSILPSENTSIDIHMQLKSSPFVLITTDEMPDKGQRAYYCGDEEMNGQLLCCFQRVKNTIQKKPVSELTKNIVLCTHDGKKEDWLLKTDRLYDAVKKHHVSERLNLIGNKTQLLESANNFSLSVNGKTQLLSEYLGILGGEQVLSYQALINVISSQNINCQEQTQIWSGNIPSRHPQKDQSIVCCLSASDVNLDEKVQRFLTHYTQHLGQTGWRPEVKNGLFESGGLQSLCQKKPNTIGLSVLSYKGNSDANAL
ncbi:hypothetical protein [Zophobihabitans entericus]|uniref:Uncharacterized protein n=1 Tax=Zophobihabitans entericus TaxID=1635327 RepID=A0A6G9I9W1_9GAMM|nr:hypothetical protein [Zophobihabitans entericus]QIQ21006.1 hypothetical protein IPMB12_04515 [Zophobihabitans entericus]